MKKVAIIDYGMGNIDSVVHAVDACGGDPCVTDKGYEVESASYIILPGVGAFNDGMRNIRRLKLDEVIREQLIERNKPFLGICLGMQLLAKKGYEVKETAGLGIIEGEVKRLKPNSIDERIPHIGWNEVDLVRNSLLFKEIDSGRDFYFVHSYHLLCKDGRDITGETPFCGRFVSAIEKNNIFGVQFHPEKSQRAGLQLIKNFLAL